jgi:hypothetical protein
LKLLDKNEALYLNYFEWKKDYDVLRGPLDGWCDWCEKLNDPAKPAKVYASMALLSRRIFDQNSEVLMVGNFVD